MTNRLRHPDVRVQSCPVPYRPRPRVPVRQSFRCHSPLDLLLPDTPASSVLRRTRWSSFLGPRLPRCPVTVGDVCPRFPRTRRSPVLLVPRPCPPEAVLGTGSSVSSPLVLRRARLFVVFGRSSPWSSSESFRPQWAASLLFGALSLRCLEAFARTRPRWSAAPDAPALSPALGLGPVSTLVSRRLGWHAVCGDASLSSPTPSEYASATNCL